MHTNHSELIGLCTEGQFTIWTNHQNITSLHLLFCGEHFGEICGVIIQQAGGNNTPIELLKDAGGWSSLVMPTRYIEAAKIANGGWS